MLAINDIVEVGSFHPKMNIPVIRFILFSLVLTGLVFGWSTIGGVKDNVLHVQSMVNVQQKYEIPTAPQN